MRQYPRLGRSGKIGDRVNIDGSRCCVRGCEKLATHYQDIEFDWMRGNDGVYVLCSGHFGLPRSKKLIKFFRMIKPDYNAD